MPPQTRLAHLAPLVLRFGFVFLFLWFGLSQIINPASWTAWVPEWTASIVGLNAASVVLLNGAFETVGGVLLAIGIWTRWVALALSLHLFFIAYEVGYNDIGIRDFTLAITALALSFFGPDRYALDSRPNKE